MPAARRHGESDGGLRTRLETVAWRLRSFLDGETGEIPELAAKLVNPWKGVRNTVVPVNYARVKTPSAIK